MPRRFVLMRLLVALVAAGVPLVAGAARTGGVAPAPVERPLPASMPQGVASGDVTQDTAVLWARSTATGPLRFEYGLDPGFMTLTGAVTVTVSDPLQPAKATVSGLAPGTRYYYRATDAAAGSVAGAFRTAHGPGRFGLRFGVSGDSRGELSPFPSIRNVPGRDLEFFVSEGDTVYSDIGSPVLGTSATTLAEYRLKHTEIYSTRLGLDTWADLRASTAIMASIDDHEVRNDFAGGADPATVTGFPSPPGTLFVNDAPRYEAGMQAFSEYHPLREEFHGATGDERTAGERRLYRYATYGRDAAIFLLDNRSFRDPDLPAIANYGSASQVSAFINSTFAVTRTMLGEQQILDLERDLLAAESAGITWKFILVAEPIQNLGVIGAPDRLEGFAAERTRLLRFIRDNAISNIVFVAADIHGTVVNNITYQDGPNQPQIPVNAFEISVGSVASGPPFGQRVMAAALAAGFITQNDYNDYAALPRDQKDARVRQMINAELLLGFQGYSPVGLEDAAGIDADLTLGSYVAAHTFGWTEFAIDAQTRRLVVSTYGIDWYSAGDLASDPGGVTGRMPELYQSFTVTPTIVLETTALPAIMK